MVLCVEVAGYISENCYFFIDEASGAGFVIDPGAQADKLLGIIKERNFKIEKILLTHGHFDHIGAASELSRALGAPILAHENAGVYLGEPDYNLSNFTGEEIIIEDFTPLKDGQRVALASGACELAVIYTPGHTSDSVVFYSKGQNLAFCGDLIFRAGFGRTDLLGGDYSALKASIEGKIFTLPDEVILYSGHGEPTSVRAERARF
ncbi:MBL fold metallo-hydrolase [Campylobacter sp. JMF_07 ED4]|uniref:MBL fold metallo-hydrolase n=1 Tax=Campylobacter sp. JMF_07 ED4 TaxID=2983840 RepID=UPI0022E9EAC6|nr:MBL fold metallo-hydrolase [Campylobacter sp. JMF_07 ED4]MDA3044414.1 MBL fold metallo-hydrolase [Campylobacter sp. JMF_07 ED4]